MDAPLTPEQIEFAVEELACLHRQVTERVRCPHRPPHEDLEAALRRIRGPAISSRVPTNM